MIIGTEKRGYNLKTVALITVLILFMTFLSVFIAEEVFASAQYTVSSAQEFNDAVASIEASAENEATIALAADISGQDDVVLDRVQLSHTVLTDIFACGHTFETTADFEGFTGNHDYIDLYGGGSSVSKKSPKTSDENYLMLYGAIMMTAVLGGITVYGIRKRS